MNTVPHIAFVCIPHNYMRSGSHLRDIVWPIPTAIMATILKKRGYRVTVIDLAVERYTIVKLAQYLTQLNPDIVVLELQTPTMSIAEKILSSLKMIRPQVVVFGQHASVFYQEIIQSEKIHFCIVGSAEFVIEPLISRILHEKKDISSAWPVDNAAKIIRAPEPRDSKDVDVLPFIDVSLLKIDRYHELKYPNPYFIPSRWGFVLTSRGCPYTCTFCSPLLRNSTGKTYVPHSIGYTIRQIQYYRDECGIRLFSFKDDVFSYDIQRAAEFCDQLIAAQLHVKWNVITRADTVPCWLLKKMKQAGCFGISLGIESGSERILALLNKGITKTQMREAARHVKEAGLLLTVYVMLGNPTETREDIAQTQQFIAEINPDILQIHYFTPYPGSLFFHTLQDRIQQVNDLYHYDQYAVNVCDMQSDDIQKIKKDMYRKQYVSLQYLKNFLKYRARHLLISPHEWFVAVRGLYSIYRS